MKPPAFFARGHASLVARLVVGGMFVYLGAIKALDPVGFLKMVRAFDLVAAPLVLNSIAAVLPWLEIVCGLLLLTGVLARGAALLSLTLLVAFTAAITWRALALHSAVGTAFCSLRFDCGCGTGEVYVCAKLIENLVLIAVAAIAWRAPEHPFPQRRPAQCGPPQTTIDLHR